MLSPKMPHFDDLEGEMLPAGVERVMDSHVHVFPDRIFNAVRGWFDDHAWPIRYRMTSPDLIAYLLERGIGRIVALQYAHKPGIAGFLNRYMAGLCRDFPGRVKGLATVFPGEPGARDILAEAFDLGLSGVKLHAHVQCFDMEGPAMTPVYEFCQERAWPMVMHVGREPNSPAYACDPYGICGADRMARVLDRFEGLRVCVPHLGFNEVGAYRDLIASRDNLWLDTAMVLTDYFPKTLTGSFEGYRLDRIIYGSDYPNIPYAWDRELKWLAGSGLSPEELDQVLYKSCAEFFKDLTPGR